jgi:ATP adenylyltransferase
MSRGDQDLDPATLWLRAAEVGERARRSGALLPIPTRDAFIEEAGIGFLVRLVAPRGRGHRVFRETTERAAAEAPPNPFLPYEEELWVATISATHVALLNKYPVIEDHLLIVTRGFEEQESLLGEADLRALWTCLGAGEALGFYNGGRVAGASQPHKHLQVVPLPLAPGFPGVPIEVGLVSARYSGTLGVAPDLPFRHALTRVDPEWLGSPATSGKPSREALHLLLRAAGLDVGSGKRQSAPYNLLATRRWMMIVPRSRESFSSISVNALGFAGALLVRNEAEMEMLREAGPLRILREVGQPP